MHADHELMYVFMFVYASRAACGVCVCVCDLWGVMLMRVGLQKARSVCVCVFSVPAVMRGRVLALVAWINVRSPVRHRDNRYWGII